MLIGYARTSMDDQAAAEQRGALITAGCERVLTESRGGVSAERPALAEALTLLGHGDTLVVWCLDRLGYSLKQLIEVVAGLEQRQIGFRSLRDGIDSSTPDGKTMLHTFRLLADFQRKLNQERTRAGLAAARARGRLGGRKRKLDTQQKVDQVQALYEDKENTIEDICQMLNISRATLYRYVTIPGSERRSSDG